MASILKYWANSAKNSEEWFNIHMKVYAKILVMKITAGLKLIKLFSCSTQLSIKYQLLIKTKMPTNEEVLCFKSLRC